MQLLDFLRDLEPDVLTEWWKCPIIQQVYRELADERIATLRPDKPGEGRGVVICAGGLRYYPSLWIGLHQLRRTGCSLPVQVWYLAPREMDPHMQRMLAHLDVTFIDASKQWAPQGVDGYPCRHGWQLKTAAILACPFREVLYLDADSLPLRNPSEIFDWPQYQEHGSVFWPDHSNYQLGPEVFTAFGVFPPVHYLPPGTKVTGKTVPGLDRAFETGQFVVDKGRCGKELQLAHYFAERCDYYWRLVHGDKETLHMAWRRLGTSYGMPQYWPDWDGHFILQKDMQGQTLFLHRTDDKWSFGGNILPGDGRCAETESYGTVLLNQLRARWENRLPWQNVHPSKAESELRKLATGLYYRFDGGETVHLRPDGCVGASKEETEKLWSVWIDEQGPLLSITDDKGGLVRLLRPEAGQTWAGEKIQLAPAVEENRFRDTTKMLSKRICVCTLATADIMPWARYGIMSKQYYCSLHGYAFVSEMQTLAPTRPVSWSKVLLLRRLLNDYDYVFWSDADAVITNYAVKLESLIDKADMCITREEPGVGSSELNAGHLLLRSCEWSKGFLEDVWEDGMADPDQHWWEQASIIRLLGMPRNARRAAILPQRSMNSYRENWCMGDLLIHFPGTGADERRRRMQEYYEVGMTAAEMLTNETPRGSGNGMA